MRWWAGLLALPLLLGACEGDDDGERSADPGGARPEPQYVALGDSYTAAPGTGDDEGEHCYQSERNYPRLLAQELGLDLTDVSCGGADTGHLTSSQVGHGNPPQFDALSADTDLVTIRIGANDAKLYGSSVYGCARIAGQDPDGAPCTEELGGGQYLDIVAQGLRTSLEGVFDQIDRLAPHARVVAVGYPQWAPREAPSSCDQLPLAEGDYPFVRRANVLIAEALAEAAAATGVEHVDLWRLTADHHMCADRPWIAGALPDGSAAAFHPYVTEQRAITDLLVDLLQEKSLRN